MSRTRVLRLLFAALAVGFFATPIALRAIGIKARAFENRSFASAPNLSAGWNIFSDTSRFLIDRMPLRYQAVHANTWIDLHVFHTTPKYGENGLSGVQNDLALPFTGNPDQDKAGLASATTTTKGAPPVQPPPTASQVAPGRDGWLFLQGVFDRACAPFVPFPTATQHWEELLRVIRSSGRRVELIVAPDKSTIYPEYVSSSTSNLACSVPGTAALWRQIESPSATRAGIIGLRRPLLAAKHATSDPLYYRTDSHWNSVGALSLVQAALLPLSRTVRMLPGEVIDTGPVHFGGDLLSLLGESGSEIAPTRSIRRAPGAPVLGTPTALIGDSYSDTPVVFLHDYIRQITVLNWNNNSAEQIAQAIAASPDVILETVEREFDYRASPAGYITPKFIALVRMTLAAHPLSRPRP
jgi:alginate O-acetyltransferase complex protein AlgJ